MAKPIIIARVYFDLKQDRLKEISKSISAGVEDEYHVLAIPMLDYYGLSIEVFNADKIPEIDIEKLKEEIYGKNV